MLRFKPEMLSPNLFFNHGLDDNWKVRDEDILDLSLYQGKKKISFCEAYQMRESAFHACKDIDERLDLRLKWNLPSWCFSQGFSIVLDPWEIE